ncbi:MAG: DNA repair and recombination protein RadB [Nanoarchaeota archaeon]
MVAEKSEKISAGSYDLNTWLYGGYESEVITMIAGSPGSGKTNFAMLAACSQAKKNNKVIFIDTEGGFSSERVKQIVGDNYEDIISNILLLEPKSFDEQKKIFEKLSEKVKKEQVGLIVVDSMAMLYRLELGDAIKKKDDDGEFVRAVNRTLAEQMKLLSLIARTQKIPVIITNQVYKEFQNEEDFRNKKEAGTHIVGGDLFKYWCKCIIELKHDSGKRKAILLKHRSLPEKELTFEIKNKGIFKKSWI